MKLAEALTIRKDLQTKISRIRERLNANARVQDGLEPNEDPKVLLELLGQTTKEMIDVICRINLTNTMTIIDGTRLGDMIVKRDMDTRKISVLRDFLNNASNLTDRYSKTEILIRSTVNVEEMQRELDRKSKEVRELDVKIQQANWTTDLL